jgi:hypothetical protein
MKEILWFDMTRQCCLTSKIQPFLQVKQPQRGKACSGKHNSVKKASSPTLFKLRLFVLPVEIRPQFTTKTEDNFKKIYLF